MRYICRAKGIVVFFYFFYDKIVFQLINSVGCHTEIYRPPESTKEHQKYMVIHTTQVGTHTTNISMRTDETKDENTGLFICLPGTDR